MSPVGVAAVRRGRPDVLESAAQELERCRREVESSIVDLLRNRPRQWRGPAARAAGQQAAVMVAGLARVGRCIAVSCGVLHEGAHRLRAAQAVVARADERARAEGAWIDEAGTLFLPVRASGLDGVEQAHRHRLDELLRAEVRTHLDEAARVAVELDRRLGADLLAAAVGGPGADAVLATGGVLPLPAPPAVAHDAAGAYASAAWWRCLGVDEQLAVIREHPQWVGPRDGVPAWARHQANLLLLAEAERAASARLARARRSTYTIGGLVAVAAAEHRVEDLRAVREVLGRRDGTQRLLLSLDARGRNVRAAVARGDTDTAEHVVTFVGGLSTTVRGDLRRYDDDFGALRAQALAEGRGADTAIVTWMGYEAPQNSELASGGRSVLLPAIARADADVLAAFVTGLAAARPQSPHLTLWAHSYGSVLAGNALLRTNAMHDVAVFGSPGVPFDRLEQVGLKAGSFNVLVAGRDLVAQPGWAPLGRRPGTVTGATMLSTASLSKLATACLPGSGVGTGGQGPDRTSVGHSQYLRPGTVSADNLVAVAVGRSDLVVRQGAAEARWVARTDRDLLTEPLRRLAPVLPLAPPASVG